MSRVKVHQSSRGKRWHGSRQVGNNQGIQGMNKSEQKNQIHHMKNDRMITQDVQSNYSEKDFHHVKGSTHQGVRGRKSFQIERPARDVHEKVASRSEALQKLQETYETKRAEHGANLKKKEAKKREQYLAKYSHVDQGHRLTEGYLDEAAGYAPGFNPLESMDGVRQRQQDQLTQAALANKELKREEKERQKKATNTNVDEWVNKHNHFYTGYKLRHVDNPGTSSSTSLVPSATGAKPKYTSALRENSPNKEQQRSQNDFNTIEELPQLVSTEHSYKNEKEKSQPMKVDFEPDTSLILQSSNISHAVQQTEVKPLKPAMCVLKNFEKPSQGAVLLIRPTQEALNQALVKRLEIQDEMDKQRLEIQDEMDKQGFSIHYKPQQELAPMFSNNRFDRNLMASPGQPSGADLKKTSIASVVPSTSSKVAENKNSDPVIDYQAEMRAARLKMQQRYEEVLKNKQGELKGSKDT